MFKATPEQIEAALNRTEERIGMVRSNPFADTQHVVKLFKAHRILCSMWKDVFVYSYEEKQNA